MAHQVLVPPQPVKVHRSRGVGEMAGRGAAECAAVCCCCPCMVIHLAVLAVYRVPKGLVLKAARKRRRRLLKSKNSDIVVLHPHRANSIDFTVGSTRLEEFLKQLPENEMDEEEAGLEKEMWARFAGTGFWRSESQRQP